MLFSIDFLIFSFMIFYSSLSSSNWLYVSFNAKINLLTISFEITQSSSGSCKLLSLTDNRKDLLLSEGANCTLVVGEKSNSIYLMVSPLLIVFTSPILSCCSIISNVLPLHHLFPFMFFNFNNGWSWS